MTEPRTTDCLMIDTAAPRLGRRLTGVLRRIILGRVPKLFDTAYYLRSHPDAAASALDPYLHYSLIGGRRGYDPNADFDTAFYRLQTRAWQNPLRHYLKVGAAKGLDPHPHFSTFSYLGRYPDVVGRKVNPLLHYRENGRPELRIADHSKRLPRTIPPLFGVPTAHHWEMPKSGQAHLKLTLLRTAPDHPAAEPIKRLRLSLGLDFGVVDQFIDIMARAPTGFQDVMQFNLNADPSRGANVPSLVLALDHCYLYPIANDGTRIIRYAEANLWDIRPIKPRVVVTLPNGTIKI
ncbi:hypothetical protein FV232_21630 [Methylobacterium sp. WL30]|uniref:hypothetical protein n=1 Tax=unclassified Methylobacterium TaxID=2615210 RepID=UPI0011CB4C05|nr:MULTISPECIES: hypothetical protein [unclassified Methylobacterium]TXM95014.1 hypothetical protein FV223_02485 [Methylobacterium sp. WL116]TXN40075.1 hypothetical protein FV225_07455 [Methylobacterium sp. WL93]TXN48969.1 hypothetical protein FV227_18700 [Methylobacterium sp. WL119]TXN64131.1 hypothetical protein FV232_21630 [Methylobacterium sp. WL30]